MAAQAPLPTDELPAATNEIVITHEDIAKLAYAAWQENGCPEGADEEFWFRAEEELTVNPKITVREQGT